MTEQDQGYLPTEAVNKLIDELALCSGWSAWDVRQALHQIIRAHRRGLQMTQPEPWPHKRRMRRRPR